MAAGLIELLFTALTAAGPTGRLFDDGGANLFLSLAKLGEEARSWLGKAGACELVVGAMRDGHALRAGGSVKRNCSVLRALAYDHPANRQRIVEDGGVLTLQAVLLPPKKDSYNPGEQDAIAQTLLYLGAGGSALTQAPHRPYTSGRSRPEPTSPCSVIRSSTPATTARGS